MTMEVRKLRPGDDLFAVSRVYEEDWREAYRGLLPLSLSGGAGVANCGRSLHTAWRQHWKAFS